MTEDCASGDSRTQRSGGGDTAKGRRETSRKWGQPSGQFQRNTYYVVSSWACFISQLGGHSLLPQLPSTCFHVVLPPPPTRKVSMGQFVKALENFGEQGEGTLEGPCVSSSGRHLCTEYGDGASQSRPADADVPLERPPLRSYMSLVRMSGLRFLALPGRSEDREERQTSSLVTM